MKTLPSYGMMAEFDSAQHLVDAAQRTHGAGYRKIDAYSPFPVEELADAIGFHKNNVPLHAILDRGHRLPDQRRRPSLSFLAVVHHRHL
jgi:hypothetical protein